MMTDSVQRFDDTTKEQVRARTDIVELIGRYVRLKPAGQNFKGLCPFHKEKTPSFTVTPARQSFHCFGCGKGGDVFSFLQGVEGMEFRDALEQLAEEAGVQLRGASPSVVQNSGELNKNDMLRIHEQAMHYYYRQIKPHPRAIEYFKGRGLKPETIRDFRLGYAPPGWSNLLGALKEAGWDGEAVVQSGLALKKEGGSTPYDRFRDRVMFTLFDATGRPIGFAGRGMEGDAQPKYLNSPETLIYHKSRVLYGLHKARAAIKDENRILVVEGYMDYLSLYQAGICNVVATSGTALTQEHGTLIRRFTERVTLVFDGDKAGITAAERAIFTLAPHNLAISVLLLPGDDDPDSFVKREGAERFRAVLTDATDALSFLLKRFTSAGELDTPQGKSAVLNRLKPLLESTADAVVRAEYIKTIAERTAVAQQLIYRLLPEAMQTASAAPSPPQRPSAPPAPPSQPSFGSALPDSRRYGTTLEGNFMRILLANPPFIPQARTYITAETFTDAFTKNLYSTITRVYDSDPALAALLQQFNDEQTKSIVAGLLSSEAPQEHAQQDLTHAIIELQKKFLRTTLRQLRLQLQSNPGNRRLLEKHKELSLQLNQLKQS